MASWGGIPAFPLSRYIKSSIAKYRKLLNKPQTGVWVGGSEVGGCTGRRRPRVKGPTRPNTPSALSRLPPPATSRHSGEVREGAHLVQRLVGVLVGHRRVRWLPATLVALQPEHGSLEGDEAAALLDGVRVRGRHVGGGARLVRVRVRVRVRARVRAQGRPRAMAPTRPPR